MRSIQPRQAWSVYYDTLQFPGLYVVRVFDLDDGIAIPAGEAYVEPDLPAARSLVPPGLRRTDRAPGDAREIVETWY